MAETNLSGHLLQTRGLACGYGHGAVISGVDLEVRSGECMAILGPNGVGKTTLFKTLLGLLPPIKGTVLVDGRERSEYSLRDLAKLLAYVPQAHSFAFSYEALDLVALGRTAHHGVFEPPSENDFCIASSCMEELGIGWMAGREYAELSGGEQQMLLIARALAQQPAFLVLDEPTSSLDFGNQACVLTCLRRLREQGLGIVMTTHNPNHAFLAATKVALVRRGAAILTGTCDEVLTAANMSEAYGVETCVGSLTGVSGTSVTACSIAI